MSVSTPVGEQSLNIKFDGQLHEVEITAFTRVLLDFAEVVKTANRQSDPNAKVDVRITATGEGSFETLIKVIISNPEGTLALVQAAQIMAGAVVGTVVGAYKLHKWLSSRNVEQGRELREGDNVTVTDVAGDSITVQGPVYNLYFGDTGVPGAISRSFAALDEEPPITGFEILDPQRRSLLQVGRDEFGPMSTEPPIALAHETITTEVVDVELRIVKLVLDRNYSRKWEFFMAGNKISANILDEHFFDQVDSGLSFAKGDALQVKLEITREYDESLGVYWNKSYSIVEVERHIPRSQTGRMF